MELCTFCDGLQTEPNSTGVRIQRGPTRFSVPKPCQCEDSILTVTGSAHSLLSHLRSVVSDNVRRTPHLVRSDCYAQGVNTGLWHVQVRFDV
jgi:hypothetical protein